jgi:tape measure domain-containing protein
MADLRSIVTADISQLERAYKRAEADAVKTARGMDAAFKKSGNPRMDFSGIKRELRALESQAKSSAGGIKSALSGLGGGNLFGGATAVAAGNVLTSVIGKIGGAMTDTVKTGVEYNKTLERSAVAFEVMTGSSQKAQTHLAELEKLALRTPFQFEDLIGASMRMQAFGVSAQDVIRDLPKLSDGAAIAAAGTGNFKESLDGIITALGQMRAKGKLSFEEINQLTERGIPAWDILAKKVGRTKEEIMRLTERGKLKGDVAADLLTTGIGEFGGGIGERLSRTVSGKESNLEDAYRKRAGEDTKVLFQSYSDALDQGVKGFGDKVGQTITSEIGRRAALDVDFFTQLFSGQISAKEIGAAIIPTFKGIVEEVKGYLVVGGKDLAIGLKDGFIGAISSLGGDAAESVKAWTKSLVDSAKSALGVRSPSTVFAAIGKEVVDGFDRGVEQKIDRSSEGFKKWAKRIEKIGGDAFLEAVEEMSKRLKVDPNKVMNVMAFESKLNPAAKNPKSSASGLIQFMDDTATAFKTTTDKLRSMSAIDQLEYVEKYFAQFRQLMDSQEELYTSVLRGRPISDPDEVLFRNTKGKAGRPYRANQVLDADRSGTITAQEATAKVYEQGFLNPTRDIVLKFDAAVERFREVPNFQAMGQVRPGPIRTALTMNGGASAGTGGPVKLPEIPSVPIKLVPSAANFATAIENLLPPIAMITDAAAKAPAPLENTAKAIDRVTQAGDDAWTRLKGQKTFAQLQKEAEMDAKDNLDPEATFKRFQDFQQRLGQNFDGAISDLINRTSSFGDLARNLLLQTVNDIFNQLISNILLKATGGQSDSIGGLIGNAIGGLFGGFFGGGKAGGGPVYAGVPYMVGEKGPEPFIPSADGYVLNRNDAMRAMSQGGGQTVVNVSNNFNITTPGGQVSRETQVQIAARAGESIDHAVRRNR